SVCHWPPHYGPFPSADSICLTHLHNCPQTQMDDSKSGAGVSDRPKFSSDFAGSRSLPWTEPLPAAADANTRHTSPSDLSSVLIRGPIQFFRVVLSGHPA